MAFDSLSTQRFPIVQLVGSQSVATWTPTSLSSVNPRVNLSVGNTLSDSNAGMIVTPSQSATGRQIATLLQVSTNKVTQDSGAKQITMYVDSTYASINSISSDGSGGTPVPLHFLVGNYINNSRNGLIINSDAENTVTIGSDTILTTAQLNVTARGTKLAAQFTGTVGISALAGSGAQMVVTDNNGVLNKQAIPSGYTVSSKSAAWVETATTGTVLIQGDTTTAGFTITLPTAVGNTAMIIIKKTAGTNNLTIGTTSSQTIDGGTTAVLSRIYESITLISNNANWLII